MTESRRAFQRARYLGEKLQSSCADELGFAGRRFVEWLCSILDVLEPAPAPPGAYLHLVLDRYLMEAAKIAQLSLSAELVQGLAALLQSEITFAKAVFALMGDDVLETEFLTALANCSRLDEASAFPTIRRVISQSLLKLAPDGCTFHPLLHRSRRAAEEVVREMIESSSRQLAAMGVIGTRPAPPGQNIVARSPPVAA
jgi:hypothetical protein